MGEKHWRQSTGQGIAKTLMVLGILRPPLDSVKRRPRTGIGTNLDLIGKYIIIFYVYKATTLYVSSH